MTAGGWISSPFPLGLISFNRKHCHVDKGINSNRCLALQCYSIFSFGIYFPNMGLKASLCDTEERFDSKVFYSAQKTGVLSAYQ